MRGALPRSLSRLSLALSHKSYLALVFNNQSKFVLSANCMLRFVILLLAYSSTAFCRPSVGKLNSSPIVMSSVSATSTSKKPNGSPVAKIEIPSSLKLLFGAGGIYAAFLYYGTLQEDVFHYKAADGLKFKEGKNSLVYLHIHLTPLTLHSLSPQLGFCRH